MNINILVSRDIIFQIMLALEMKDLSKFAQINKLSTTIAQSDYFWQTRYKRDYPELTVNENINYRKICKYKFIHTSKQHEIYNVFFYHKEYKSPKYKLQIKTQKRSEIYNYIAHLYNYEQFPEKQYIRLSLIRGLRKINEKRFNSQDNFLINEFYDQYYNENSQMIKNIYFSDQVIENYEIDKLKSQITYSTKGFYGTNNLSLTDFSGKYKHIVLKFFDFLYLHNFRRDLIITTLSPTTPVAITPSLIKKVITHSKTCIVLSKDLLIEL